MKILFCYLDGHKMASLKFSEVSKLLNTNFNDKTSRCQAKIASNELQTSDVYQPQKIENSNRQFEEKPLIRTLVEDARITFENGQLSSNELSLNLFDVEPMNTLHLCNDEIVELHFKANESTKHLNETGQKIK